MDWIKVIVNAAISGAIAGFSLFIVNGSFNPEVSLIAAVATGIMSFLIELKQHLNETTSVNPGQKKGISRLINLF